MSSFFWFGGDEARVFSEKPAKEIELASCYPTSLSMQIFTPAFESPVLFITRAIEI